MTVQDVQEPATEPEYDPEAPPLGLTGKVESDDERVLRDLLWSLQQLGHAKDDIEKRRKELLEQAIPLQKKLGRPVMITHPVTGEVQIAGIREDEVLKVDAGELLDELVKHFKAQGLADNEAEFEADTVWKSTLKPPAVDTKLEGGLFRKAVEHGKVPGYVAAKVMTLQRKAGWIDFTKPKRG